MDRWNKFLELVETFLRIINKYKNLDDKPRSFGTEHLLYKSEVHTIEAINKHKDCNMTCLANQMGITKGALSQIVNKLEKMGLVRKNKKKDNEKEIFLELSKTGHKANDQHEEFHKNHFKDLYEIFSNINDEQILFLEFVFKKIEEQFEKFIECDCCEGCGNK